MMDLDLGLFRFHRAATKGEGIAPLLAQIGADLEPAEFSALTAVSRLSHGIGRPAPVEPTVGALAEELALDPSRASRLAQGLIGKGMLRREPSQQDGRRAVLALSDQAKALFRTFRDVKWTRYMAVMADWSDEDIVTFARLFHRYGEGMRAWHAENGAP